MRSFIFVVWCGICLAQVALAEDVASPVAEPTSVRQVGLAELTALGQAALDLAYDGRNVFIRRERTDELSRIAEQTRNAQLEFAVQVRRVTEKEVFIELPSAWPARVALRHGEPPRFGNLRSWTYRSTPSTRTHEFYALPVGLRIGAEISLDLAKQLQRGDTLVVAGRVDSTLLLADSTFFPPVLVVVANWSVAGG